MAAGKGVVGGELGIGRVAVNGADGGAGRDPGVEARGWSRLLCLFYTEDMFMLIQMRKNVKKKLISLIEKWGSALIEDFDQNRVVKRGHG